MKRQPMPHDAATAEETAGICRRFLRMYTGAIADMLDKRGHRNQVLPRSLAPFTVANRVAGPAFTG